MALSANDPLASLVPAAGLDSATLANYAPAAVDLAALQKALAGVTIGEPTAAALAAGNTGQLTPYYVAGGSEPLNFTAQPDQQYRLVDTATGKTLSSGTGIAGATQISKAIDQLNSQTGDQANYTIQTLDPSLQAAGASDPWTAVGGHLPQAHPSSGLLGDLIPFITGAIALGGAPIASLVGGAAGGGSAAASGLDALAAAPLSGAAGTAGAADLAASIAPTLGAEAAGAGLGALAPAAATAAEAVPAAAAAAPGFADITVLAPAAAAAPVAASPLAVAGMAALPAAVAAEFPGGVQAATQAAQPPETYGPETVVNAPAPVAAPATISPALAAAAPLSAAAGIAGAQAAADAAAPSISASSAPASSASSSLASLSKALQAGAAASTLAGLATGSKSSGSLGTIPAGLASDMTLPSIFSAQLPAAQPMFGAVPNVAPQNVVVPYEVSARDYPTMSVMPTVDSVQAALARGAAGGIAATDPLAVIPPQQPVNKAEGGSIEPRDYDMEGALAAGVKPDKYGHMPDTYKLPNHMTFSEGSIYSTPEHLGGKWLPGNDGSWTFWPTQFNMSQHSLPEMQSYFSRVEQNIPGRPDSFAIYPIDYRLPPRDNKAHGGMAVYAEGGAAPSDTSFAVDGPGTGRSDSIPAKLSDGEYVMDAETVALLGDGSSKAGADALDKMRINIRKQKGKNLAQGKFSVKAKAPEAYMTGGRL